MISTLENSGGDTSNFFGVGGQGDFLVITKLPMGRLPKAQAINLAAWLRVLADPEGKEFDRVVAEIKKT